MRDNLLKKEYEISLADHGQTLLVEGHFDYLSEIKKAMLKQKRSGKWPKVWIIKVKGFHLEPLRKTWNEKDFDEIFDVQAEYKVEEKHFVIVRSNNPKLPVKRPLAFSGPPIPIP